MLKPNSMKLRNITFIITFFACYLQGFGQYNMSANNGQVVSACSGTLTDTASGNYTSGATQTITIQSPTPGQGV